MSFQPDKCDPELGWRVHEHLVKLGVETPMVSSQVQLDSNLKVEQLTSLFTNALQVLGMNLADDSLSETPSRIAKMLVLETMWGLNPAAFPKCTTVENKLKYSQMVLEKNVRIQSMCEHHWQNISGVAHIAYIPDQKILGLSKLNRIAEYFSRRGQIQERLTVQILETLKFVLETDSVAVVVDAEHNCVKARGVQDQDSSTITSALSGAFKHDAATRGEFMSFVNAARAS